MTGVQTCALPIYADIRFQPESIFQMLMAEKDVIGGLYPKKSLPISYVINAVPGTKVEADGTFKVDTMGSEERRVGKECRSRWSPYH